MKLIDLIDACRQEIKDSNKPYLVDDPKLIRFANQAQTEAARRARLLVDSASDICRLDVSAGEPVIEIDPRIISIRRARLQSVARPLSKRKVRDMDECFCGWDSSTNQSTPFFLVTDYGTNELYLYPTPNADTTLLLTVTREPLTEMGHSDDTPEIAPRYHEGLVLWMKHRAYLMDDTDLYSPASSAKALADFEAEFGKPMSAVDEQFEFENYDDVGER